MISDEISKLTGVFRTRKQVSSHLQVIKPMVKDDPYSQYLDTRANPTSNTAIVMQYLCIEDEGPSKSRHHRRNPHSLYRPRTAAISNSPYHHSQPQGYGTHVHAKQQNFGDYPLVAHKPCVFDMFIQDKSLERKDQIIHRLCHLRVSTQNDSRANAREKDRYIPNARLIKCACPALWPLFERGALRDCQVICAKAVLDLYSGHTPPEAELSISFQLETDATLCDLRAFEGFECETSVWQDGKEIYTNRDEPIEKRQVHFIEDHARLDYLPLGSSLWAKKISGYRTMLRNARAWKKNAAGADAANEQHDKEVALQNAKKFEESVRRDLKSLSAVCQVSARLKGSDEGSRRLLLVMHWNFSQAEPEKPADMTWANVTCEDLGAAMGVKESDLATQAGSTMGDWKFDLDTTLGIPGFHHQPSASAGHHLFPGFGHLTNGTDSYLDFNTLPSLNGLNGITNSQLQTPSTYQSHSNIYSANNRDFTGGHIHLSLDLAEVDTQPLSAGTEGTMNEFGVGSFAVTSTHQGTHDALNAFSYPEPAEIGASQPASQHQPMLYAPQPTHPGTQQWHSAYSQGPYFDLNGFGTETTTSVPDSSATQTNTHGGQQAFRDGSVTSRGGHIYGSFSAESDGTVGHSFAQADAVGERMQGVDFDSSAM